jgi:hypothetical protein
LGTEITLDVAGMSVTYSKNHRGIDHGSIFQERDRKAIKTDQIDYDWYAKEGEDPTPSEMAFTRPLKHVVPRLELLALISSASDVNMTPSRKAGWRKGGLFSMTVTTPFLT